MRRAGKKLDARYGDWWDFERRVLDAPLTVAEARSRHAAGEPYAVLLGDGGRPRVLLKLIGDDGHLDATCFDDQLRGTSEFEFEMISPDRMVLLWMREWRYSDADQPDRGATVPNRLTAFRKDGEPEVEGHGAADAGFRTLDRRDRWLDVPRFREWSALAGFVLGTTQRAGHRIARPARRARPAPSGASWAWEPVGGSPPGPLRPGPEVGTAFGPPARFVLESDGAGAAPEVVVEALPAGRLRVPTGRLVAADADQIHDGMEPFTVALPPGDHPVTLAVARFVDEPDRRVVAAWRMDVREAPVGSWEPALRPGEDPSTLGDGEFFPTVVESGVLLVFDAAALSGLAVITWVREGERVGWWEELTAMAQWQGAGTEPLNPETEVDLLPFPSGWGDGAYPVWIGRAADGDVVSVVVDTRVLSGATRLGPTGDRQERTWWSTLWRRIVVDRGHG